MILILNRLFAGELTSVKVERKVCDTREGRRGTAEGKHSPCAFGRETPELLLAHITRIWRWGTRSDVVKLKQNYNTQHHDS